MSRRPMKNATAPSDSDRVLNAFRNLVKALRLADRAGVKEYGLGAAQIYVLNELRESAPLSVSELAARTGTDQSTVSVVVAKLVTKGLITNRRSDADARRIELVLTPKGTKALKKLPPPVQQQIVAAVDQLPPARARALADSLQEIVERMGISSDRPPLMFDDALTAPKKPRKAAAKKS